MKLTNSLQGYGLVSIIFHWVLAVAIIALWFLGYYMVDLDYYDQLYHKLPPIHKASGLLIGLFMLLRLCWVLFQKVPKQQHFARLSRIAHRLMYLLIFCLVISGYLMSTAKGHSVDIFGIIEVPAMLEKNDRREELVGDIHEILSRIFILLLIGHILAAFYHQLILKDNTMKRMIYGRK